MIATTTVSVTVAATVVLSSESEPGSRREIGIVGRGSSTAAVVLGTLAAVTCSVEETVLDDTGTNRLGEEIELDCRKAADNDVDAL